MPSTPKALWASVIVAVAILLVGLRIHALPPGISSFESGRLIGKLIAGPIILGALVWSAAWVVFRRRSHSPPTSLQNGFVVAIAIAVIVAALVQP